MILKSQKSTSLILSLMMATVPALGGFTPAQAELVIEITQGTAEPLPIAIPDFTVDKGVQSPEGQEIAKIVSNDLKLSGLFKPLDPSSFIEKAESIGTTPRFQDWRIINAQALSTGRVIKDGSKLRIEARLWDVLAEKQMEGVAFTGNTSDIRRLAHKVSNAIYKRLTGDEGYFDTKIVFVSESAPNHKNNARKLTIMDHDGANLSYLTNGQNIVLTPRFSPVRPEITYMAFTGQKKTTEAQVYTMNLATGQKTPLGKFKGMTYAPRYSSDGTKVIFSQTQEGYSSIYTMDLKSRAITRLTNTPAIDTSPCYSPDGKQIVFNSDRSGKRHIYVMDANGGNPRRISFGDGIYATPVWSPRGDLIAFTKINKGKFHIGVMRPDGSGERLITEGYVVEGPTWAPNGRLILFTREGSGGGSGRGETSKLFVIDITGKYEREISTPQEASSGSWSPLDYK